MQICYEPKKFQAQNVELIELANEICASYEFSVTLRQLYYRFIARDFFPNNDRSYKRLGSVVADARMAGVLDWDFIIDRTRFVRSQDTWTGPEALIQDAAKGFLMDLWAPQKRRLEVWIEKDAAIGTIEHACNRNHVPFFSCRGFVSHSAMFEAAARIGEALRNGERFVILHIGDHDPSGIDMTRDITDRLTTFVHQDWANEFMGSGRHTRGDIRHDMRARMRRYGSDIEDHELPWEVRRIALTYDQIEQYGPPPNYAKETDSRYQAYVEATGLTDSWELDALDPQVLEDLIQTNIDAFKDHDAYDKAEFEQERQRQILTAVKENWDQIATVHEPKIGKAP